jgi:hypothetical protein
MEAENAERLRWSQRQSRGLCDVSTVHTASSHQDALSHWGQTCGPCAGRTQGPIEETEFVKAV